MTKFKFSEGERVLCFHGPLLYEAKALKCTVSKDTNKYYIHYAGWNKNWDEWVPENRVLKFSEANIDRQKDVFQHHAILSKQRRAAKGKKLGDPIFGDFRAMTPSKDVNSSTSAAVTSTTTATTPTTSSSSRGSRGSKQSAAARPTTPSNKETESSNKKEDSVTKEEPTSTSVSTGPISKESKDDKDDTHPSKKKRGSSHTSDKSATTNTSTTPTPPSSSTGTASTSGGGSALAATPSFRDGSVESEEKFLVKIEVKIKIPEELKQCLTDDWDSITRQRKLLDVPAKVTVKDILEQYLASKKAARSTNSTKELATSEVIEGLIEYFNVMIGQQLLYKYERPQYVEALSKYPDKMPSELYGSFHLLRLFVKLGGMLAYSALDERSVQNLLNHIHDFLKFLVKNSATYFNMSYFVNVDSAHFRQTQQ